MINAGAALALAMTMAGCAGPVAPVAHEARADALITVVAHLDVARSGLDNARGYLRDYIATAERQPGAMRIELLQQVTNANHFTLVEVWADQQAYEAHVASADARAFRAKLDPLLGSPHDERLFINVAEHP